MREDKRWHQKPRREADGTGRGDRARSGRAVNDFDRAVVDEITRDRRALDEAAQARVVLIHRGAEVDGSVADGAATPGPAGHAEGEPGGRIPGHEGRRAGGRRAEDLTGLLEPPGADVPCCCRRPRRAAQPAWRTTVRHSVLRPDTTPHQPAPNDAVLLPGRPRCCPARRGPRLAAGAVRPALGLPGLRRGVPGRQLRHRAVRRRPRRGWSRSRRGSGCRNLPQPLPPWYRDGGALAQGIGNGHPDGRRLSPAPAGCGSSTATPLASVFLR